MTGALGVVLVFAFFIIRSPVFSCSHALLSPRNAQTIDEPTETIHLNLGCYILQSKANTSAVRSGMPYGSTIWHLPKDATKSNTSMGKLIVILDPLQGKVRYRLIVPHH